MHIKFKACSNHEDTETNLDMIVRPSNNLAVQGSQRKTELALAHDFLAGVLTNVSLQMLDFRQDYLRAIIVLQNLMGVRTLASRVTGTIRTSVGGKGTHHPLPKNLVQPLGAVPSGFQ